MWKSSHNLQCLEAGKYLILTVDKGDVTSLLRTEQTAPIVFSTSRSVAFIQVRGSHFPLREHPQWLMWQPFGEKQNHAHEYLLKGAEDLKTHIWMNFS